jgi:CBS domain-containing protein
MDSLHFILRNKASEVFTVCASATVLEATREMNRHRIGALVVIEGERIAGIFTERDVLRKVVGEDISPSQVTVGEVMSKDIIFCTPDTDIEDASCIMRDKRIRHLPVCDGEGKLLGMVSIGDLNAYYVLSQEAKIQNLRDYVYGRA